MHIVRTSAGNIAEYKFFLQYTCKIPFQFYSLLKWRNLSGPEKYCLDLTNLFPRLSNVALVQQIWSQLNGSIRSESLSLRYLPFLPMLSRGCNSFYRCQVCHTLHACFSLAYARISQGAVNTFTQGVEKLNNRYTTYYFHSTHHREADALKEFHLKKNRLEYLVDNGFERTRRAMFVLCVRSQGTIQVNRVHRKYWSVYCYWIGQAYMTLYCY